MTAKIHGPDLIGRCGFGTSEIRLPIQRAASRSDEVVANHAQDTAKFHELTRRGDVPSMFKIYDAGSVGLEITVVRVVLPDYLSVSQAIRVA